MMVHPPFLASKPVFDEINSVHNAFKVENQLWYLVNLPHCHPTDFDLKDVCSMLL
jgi:hypothetical protein